MSKTTKPDWWIFKGEERPHDGIRRLDTIPPPPWRNFTPEGRALRGKVYRPEDDEIELVNAAIYLRRPLLVTGRAGIGKTTLAYAIAHELNLGSVLRWSVTTQSTLKDALYRYDAVGRLQETSLRWDARPTAPDEQADTTSDSKTAPERKHKAAPIEEFLRLGPLGTAFADSLKQPRVLLVDEIDKSDIDLPNDLLHIFEEGEFEIPELARLADKREKIPIQCHEPGPKDAPIMVARGKVRCEQFPIVIMTSNGEREFPPAFLRRCLRLEVNWPEDNDARKAKLLRVVEAHLSEDARYGQHKQRIDNMLNAFIQRLDSVDENLATDQLLNVIYMVLKGVNPQESFANGKQLLDSLFRSLSR